MLLFALIKTVLILNQDHTEYMGILSKRLGSVTYGKSKLPQKVRVPNGKSHFGEEDAVFGVERWKVGRPCPEF